MRVARIELENFAGIKKGTGLDSVSVEFPEGTPRVCMLAGANGSGKTTLLSHLQPFSTSNDLRKRALLPGTEGRKTLAVVRDGVEYEVEHLYRPKARDGGGMHEVKSFLRVDGDEINPNGGVRTFEKLVEERLGLTRDFFMVGRIGTNVGNFVDLGPSDRKKYIGKFMPNIDVWRDAHQRVAEKWTAARRRRERLSHDLETIGAEEALAEVLKAAAAAESKAADERTAAAAETGAARERAEAVKAAADEAREFFSGAGAEIRSLESGLEAVKRELAELGRRIGEVDDPAAARAEAEAERRTLEAAAAGARAKADGLLSKVASRETEISRIKSYMDGPATSTGLLETAKANLARFKASAEKLMGEVDAMRAAAAFPVDKLEGWIEDKGLDKVVDVIRRKAAQVEASTQRLKDLRSDWTLLSDGFFDAPSLIQYGADLDQEVFHKETAVAELKAKVDGFGIGEWLNANAADMRCEAGDCPYEAARAGVGAKDGVLAELRTAEADMADAANRNKDREAGARGIERFEAGMEAPEFQAMLNPLFPPLNDETRAFADAAREGDVREAARRLRRCPYPAFDVESALELTAAVADQRRLVEHVEAAEREIALHQQGVTRLTGLEDDLRKVESERDAEAKELEAAEKDAAAAEKARGDAADTLLALDKLGLHRKSRDELAEKLAAARERKAEAEKTLAAEKTLLEELKAANARLGELDAEWRRLLAEREAAEKRLDTVRRLKTERADVDRDMRVYDLVREATDLSRGIPMRLLDGFMDGIRSHANALLDMAFDGDMRLAGFEVSRTEFSMPVARGDGTVVPDVLEASQGEVAMAKTAVSMAVFRHALGEYDVLGLDEIDAELDADNREKFVRILNQQIDELGVEQVFAISHNQNFYDEDVGLVLFPGHGLPVESGSFMDGKTLLADFT